MAENSAIIDTIQDLIGTCRDGERDYKDAAYHARNPELKARFLDISTQRGIFASQLETELLAAGGTPSIYDGPVVAIDRAWSHIREAPTGDDHAILAWLEQEEDAAKSKYERGLKSDLPDTTSALVRQQFQAILGDHDQIKTLRDARMAA